MGLPPRASHFLNGTWTKSADAPDVRSRSVSNQSRSVRRDQPAIEPDLRAAEFQVYAPMKLNLKEWPRVFGCPLLHWGNPPKPMPCGLFYKNQRIGWRWFATQRIPIAVRVKAWLRSSSGALADPPDRRVWSKVDGGPGRASASEHHGDFDDDQQTLASLTHILERGFA